MSGLRNRAGSLGASSDDAAVVGSGAAVLVMCCYCVANVLLMCGGVGACGASGAVMLRS
jgi:hypothetical protein